MVKKQFTAQRPKAYNDMSDVELIEELDKGTLSRGRRDVVRAILDKRTKRVIQYLTEVIQKSGQKTSKYNKILIGLTIAIFILGCVTAWLALENLKINRMLGHIDTDPEIYISLNWAGSDRIGRRQFSFGIKNSGKIDIVNLFIAHRPLVFSKKENKFYRVWINQGNVLDEPGENWLIENRIEPEGRAFEVFSVSSVSENYFNVEIFDIRYYRESDSKEYKHQEKVFIDKDKIYKYSEAQAMDSFKEAVNRLQIFLTDDSPSLYELQSPDQLIELEDLD